MANLISRRALIASGLAAAGAALIDENSQALRQPPNRKVVVWSEGTAPKEIYPNDVNTAIADGLAGLNNWDIVTASLNDPDQGITDDLLHSTSTLIWFGSLRHNDVNDDLVAKIVKRVKEDGMGFIATHSSHFSKPFKQLLGTNCGWKYYVNDGSKLTVVVKDAMHPVAKGIKDFDCPKTERYGNPFEVPEPDDFVFDGIYTLPDGATEHSQHGLTWEVGKGRVFYFQPGHESYPIYFQAEIRAVFRNAVLWAGQRAHVSASPVAALGAHPAASAIVFADFESGTYDGWTLIGNCWTPTPVSASTFPKITGYQGKFYLCTYHPKWGNSATGKAISKEFTIEKPFITFRIGGGNYPSETGMKLVVDGKSARTITGNNSSELMPAMWDLSGLVGSSAHLEIYDLSQADDRGYIMVDNIRFTDQLPYRLIRKKSAAFKVKQIIDHGAFTGTIIYPVPPNDPGQEIRSSQLYLENNSGRRVADTIQDSLSLHQPVYHMDVDEPGDFRVTAEVEVQFFECALQFDDMAPEPPPIDPALRRVALDDGWQSDAERDWYRDWMQSEGLLRGKSETDFNYAFRILQFMQKHFTYAVPDDNPDYKAAVAAEGGFGNWKYRIKTRSGECERLSEIYARTLRMNGVPARIVSGNFVEQKDAHHIRTLVWLESVGWIPVEPTAVTSNKNELPSHKFGNWGGTMLNSNVNVGFSVPVNGSQRHIGTLDSLWLLGANGKDETTREYVCTRL